MGRGLKLHSPAGPPVAVRASMQTGNWDARAEWMEGEIVDAFLKCAERRPLAEVRMNDVARELKLSAPALYKYFRSRADLEQRAAETAMTLLEDITRKSMYGQHSVRERHRALVGALHRISERGHAVLRLLDT